MSGFRIDTILFNTMRDVNGSQGFKGAADMQPRQQNQAPILVSKREAAALLGVCVRSIDNYIASKELPCRRIGRRTLVPYSGIVAFSRRDHPTIQGKQPPRAEAPSCG